MIKLRLDNLTFSYPSKPILSQVFCEIHEKTVYGVIGANGSGKTTLLKLILGELKPDSGTLLKDKDLEIAYMAQDVNLDFESSAFNETRKGAKRILALGEKLVELEAKFADPHTNTNPSRLARLIDEHARVLEDFNRLGGSGLDGRIISLLHSLGFKDEEFDLEVGKLSGGQKKLIGLAKIMIGQPDVLLLDEPDNHLDLDGKILLENLIKSFQGVVIIVSHDRYFLDMVVDQIIEIEREHVTTCKGNYSEYMFEKQLRNARQAQLFQAQHKEITRLEQAAKRLLTWGEIYNNDKFSDRGKAILKRLDRIERIEKPQTETQKLEFDLGGWSGSRKVLELSAVSKSFESPDKGSLNVVLNKIDLYLRYGERVGLVGSNGSGKSVLTRIILGQMEVDSGEIYIGPSVRIGNYAQEFETLNLDLMLLEAVCKAGNYSESKGVAFMRKFGFDYEQRDTLVGKLSGGERARLQIAMITLSGANFLLLDEPTNHLDIPSCEVLEDALLEFEGTILAISHDRYFLDRIATRICVLGNEGITSYPGNYSDYQTKQAAL
ncbi:MAG: ATP-binding cassette domain-containing protein [Anaerolineaceae bacterium]|nr:ATP-binding cassette domain-containing protein [Anaerolineaceae bacterium]